MPTPTRQLIDCDVHYDPRSMLTDLAPYMPDLWRSYIANRGFGNPPVLPYALWQGPERLDVEPGKPEEGRASMDPSRLRQHLDDWQITTAIITPGRFLGTAYLPQREFAAALAAAHNDMTVERWLSSDDRLLGSIFVAGQDVAASVREIDRLAEHPRMVQLVLPTRSPGTGSWADERYEPMWQAAVRNDLVVAFHLVGAAGDVPPPTTYGWPRSYMELSVTYPIAAQCELSALVCRGVLSRHPTLKIAMIENGFDWVPYLMWQMDKRWRELRAEVPWLTRRPSDYLRDQVRFTTQPMSEPPQDDHLIAVIEMMESDRMLMFSSDWPHWDFDSPSRALPRALNDELADRIFYRNAAEFYGIQEKVA